MIAASLLSCSAAASSMAAAAVAVATAATMVGAAVAVATVAAAAVAVVVNEDPRQQLLPQLPLKLDGRAEVRCKEHTVSV